MVTNKKLKMHGHTIISTSTGHAPNLFDENPQKTLLNSSRQNPFSYHEPPCFGTFIGFDHNI